MLKSSLLKVGVITVLLLSILCSCSRTGTESENAKPTASIELNEDTDTIKEPIYSESPGIRETTKPNPSPDNNSDPDTSNSGNNDEDTPIQTSVVADNGRPADHLGTGIRIVMDRNTAKKGEIITANVTLNNIEKLAGYQVNIKYDPSILQAVDPDSGEPLTNTQMPGDGDILVNSDYNIIPLVSNSVENGVINFGKAYMNVDKYRESNNPESSGLLAVIGFKVLEEKSTTVAFANTQTMPDALSGTFLYDWNFNILTNYSVGEPEKIN